MGSTARRYTLSWLFQLPHDLPHDLPAPHASPCHLATECMHPWCPSRQMFPCAHVRVAQTAASRADACQCVQAPLLLQPPRLGYMRCTLRALCLYFCAPTRPPGAGGGEAASDQLPFRCAGQGDPFRLKPHLGPNSQPWPPRSREARPVSGLRKRAFAACPCKRAPPPRSPLTTPLATNAATPRRLLLQDGPGSPGGSRCAQASLLSPLPPAPRPRPRRDPLAAANSHSPIPPSPTQPQS